MYRLQYSEVPDKSYIIIPSNCIECGREIDPEITRLNSFRTSVTFLFEGTQYDCGDFRIRLATQRGVNAGVIVDIEYRPCADYRSAAPVIEEFINVLTGSLKTPHEVSSVDLSKLATTYNLSASFNLRHLSVMYMSLLGSRSAIISTSSSSTLN
jgi:TATA-binding related factor (TRF) of subunit 20 of Mediator complex